MEAKSNKLEGLYFHTQVTLKEFTNESLVAHRETIEQMLDPSLGGVRLPEKPQAITPEDIHVIGNKWFLKKLHQIYTPESIAQLRSFLEPAMQELTNQSGEAIPVTQEMAVGMFQFLQLLAKYGVSRTQKMMQTAEELGLFEVSEDNTTA